MPYFLEGLIAAIVSVIANVVYIDLRRKGEHGFGRFAAFFAGLPLTWIWLFTIPEGRAPRIAAPPDDEERLLREIRVDREIRERRAAPRPKHDRSRQPGLEQRSGADRGSQSEPRPGKQSEPRQDQQSGQQSGPRRGQRSEPRQDQQSGPRSGSRADPQSREQSEEAPLG